MKIYTVIPYFTTENEVNTNEVQSFTHYDDAYYYANSVTDGRHYDIIENELDDVRTD